MRRGLPENSACTIMRTMWQMTGEDNRTRVEYTFLSFHFFHSFPQTLSSHLGPSHHRCKQQNKMTQPSFPEVVLKPYQLHLEQLYCLFFMISDVTVFRQPLYFVLLLINFTQCDKKGHI